MLAKLRQVMLPAGSSLLTGRVEVDETFIGGPRAGMTGTVHWARRWWAPVITDGCRSYPPALDRYSHQPINISVTHRPAHEALPAAHRLFVLVKRSLEGTYQGAGSVEHLPEYLNEFVFRFNRRHSRHRGLVFFRLLQRDVTSQPVAYNDLVRVPRPKRPHRQDLPIHAVQVVTGSWVRRHKLPSWGQFTHKEQVPR